MKIFMRAFMRPILDRNQCMNEFCTMFSRLCIGSICIWLRLGEKFFEKILLCCTETNEE